MLITDSRDLAAFCKRLEGAPYVAVDTEFLREKTYWPKLCLVQVAYDDEAAAIDPLAKDIDLDPLFNLMDDESVLKVFHSASQDMEVFFSVAGRVPEPVFDTQVAAMVAGYGEQVGYATLAAQIAGVTLDKSSQITDWSIRPLSDRQIAYALGDVTHLCTIYEELDERLEESGRISWVSEEMAALTDTSSYNADPNLAYRRVRIRRPSRKVLAILREIVAWREETAQRRNLPRNWVIRDDALVEIATHAPKNVADLSRVRGLRGNAAKGRDGEALLKAVQRALDMPQSEWPEIPPRRPPIRGHEALVALLQTLLRLRCEDNDVATKLVATREELDRIATTDDSDLRPLQGWRYELFGKDALEMKAGRLGLTGDRGQVRVLRPDELD
ncbi:MAG: ribonuclease D [Chloroflexi bacterium]|nr:ribonuclease D [Chloroflexota bacterium]MBT4514616.1 ribonuclease D [Chloroflexota bacterium]